MPLNKETVKAYIATNSSVSHLDHQTGYKKKKSKVGDHSQGWPEDSVFNSYYTEM